jgi:hypothetical protein
MLHSQLQWAFPLGAEAGAHPRRHLEHSTMIHRMKPEDILSALETAATRERKRALESAAVLGRRAQQRRPAAKQSTIRKGATR